MSIDTVAGRTDDTGDPGDTRDPGDTAGTTDTGAVQPRSADAAAAVRRARRVRRAGLGLMLLGGVVVLGFVWVFVTGLIARHELQEVQKDVRAMRAQITAGNFSAARSTAGSLATHADRARELTTGPAWATFAALPGAQPIRTVRAITSQLDDIGTGVVPQLVAASTKLDPSSLRLPDGSIQLSRISAVAPVLDNAIARIDRARTTIGAQPARTWLGPVDAARSGLLQQLGAMRHTLRSADLAARIAPAMLGADGTKRYFLSFQNEAEARGTGGIPGAFAIVRAEQGRLSFERFESDTTLGITPVTMNFGADYASLFAYARTTSRYVNTNLSPHYPYAAQTWMAMWAKHSGERLDGAIAVDPTAMSYLLKVTGPVRLPDGTQVSYRNVVALTQSTVYAKYPGFHQSDQRKAYLLELANAVGSKVLNPADNTTRLVRAGATAAGQRRILVYSADPAVEKLVMQTSMSGAIPITTAPYAGLSIVNNGGNKLDYYLDRSLHWQAQGCGPVRAVTATVALRNNAPAKGLSTYVTARSDDHSYPVRPGDNNEEISYYATSGAVLQSVLVNGRPASAELANDLGHPVFTIDVEVPRGTTTTVTFQLSEPNSTKRPIVLQQPLVHPLLTTIEQTRCG